VIFSDGRVSGIKGRSGDGRISMESARVVVGADGKYSRVAAAVGAKKYRVRPTRAIAYYAYWEGLQQAGGEIYERPRRSVGVWPTNDGLVVTFLSAPAADLNAFRSDIEGSFLRTFDAMGDLGGRIRAGRRVGRFLGSVDLPNFFHGVRGPGWTLVGDAGLTMDPITGQGISQALQDADLAADAIGAGLGGTVTLEAALAAYEKARNRRAVPIYDLTTRLATFGRRPYEEDLLYSALKRNPAEVDRLLAVFAGAIPMPEYTSPANMVRVLGWGGLAAVLADKLRVRPGRYFGGDGDQRWN
jgi:2-polyprenyl-6-methoxyphenol hydroxylase-like FAD-dependent oxidoreductase